MKYLEQHIAGRHPYCSHCGKEIELIAQEDLPSGRTILSFRHFPGGVNWSKEIGYDSAINEFVPPSHLSEMLGQVIENGVRGISRHCEKVWKKPKPAQIDYDWNVDSLVGLTPKDVEKTQEALGKAIAESFESYVASQIIPQGFLTLDEINASNGQDYEAHLASQLSQHFPNGLASPAAPGVTVNKPTHTPRNNQALVQAAKPKPAITNRNIVRKILL